jgi:hypothetical protein
MPDFLSRLVERTFNLVTVAQPVIGSIFSPESSVRNGYPVQETNAYDSVRERESLSDQNNVHIDNSQKTRIIPKRDDQPTPNWKKPLIDEKIKLFDQIEDLERKTDDESGLRSLNVESSMIGSTSSISSPAHIIGTLSQNNSGFPEQIDSEIESVTLHQMSERNNRYLNPLAAELALDAESLYLFDSDTLEPEESKPLQAKNQNNQSILTSIPKPLLIEEQSQNPEIISLKQTESKLSHLLGVQKNLNIHFSAALEPNLPYENLSDGKHFNSNNPGENSSWQKKPFVDEAAVGPAGKILPEHISNSNLTSGNQESPRNDELIIKNNMQAAKSDLYSSSHLHSDTLLPMIPILQNTKQVITQRASAVQEQMGNMPTKQHAVASRSPIAVPTIKVTIGRIEVRAIKPAPASSTLAPQLQTPSPPRQHPILSLDDYLKQHNG